MLNTIRLIVLDLDGTLLWTKDEFSLYQPFAEKMEQLHNRHGIRWAICTGRTRGSFKDVIVPLRSMGALPHFVIYKHSYVHTVTRWGDMPHPIWNICSYFIEWYHRVRMHRVLNRAKREVLYRFRGAGVVRHDEEGEYKRVWFRFPSPETTAAAAELLASKLRHYKLLRVFPYRLEVDVKTVPFSKGLAVRSLCRHLKLAPEHVLTVGDGHNDVSMFGPDVAAYTGCPANAEEEVLEEIHRLGGHVAGKAALAGVLEIIDAHMSGNVNSALPENWVPPSQRDNPSDEFRRHRGNRYLGLGKVIFFLSVVYAILLVFANYDMVPFSGLIMKPYYVLLGLSHRLMHWIWGY